VRAVRYTNTCGGECVVERYVFLGADSVSHRTGAVLAVPATLQTMMIVTT
jgi:hypothetical protein